MFTQIQVIRAKFKNNYGSSSTLIAVDDLDNATNAIDEYARLTNSQFIEIEDTCCMTPVLFTKD